MKFFPSHVSSLDDKIQHTIIWGLRALSVVAMVLAFMTGQIEQIVNGVFGVVLLFLPEFIERRYRFKLPIEYSLIIVLFIYGSLVLGGVQEYYDRIPWWDSMLHLSSGVMLGFAGFLIFYVMHLRQKIHISAGWLCFFAFSFALSLGTVWEVYEFIMDEVFGTTMQPGLVDTMRDLILDGGGAILSLLVGYWFLKRKGPGLFARLIHNFLEHNPQFKK